MADITFEEVVKLVEQLTSAEQQALAALIQSKQSINPTRETALAEFERRKAAGLFANHQPLRNQFASEQGDNLTEEDLLATLREVGAAWEIELDELINDRD